ncbi:MAG: AAA family ATPase [Blastochloris sp.]|nr:AAA family ATPase [Blastochloris sp.]
MSQSFDQGFTLPRCRIRVMSRDLFHRGNFHDLVLGLKLSRRPELEEAPWARECFIIISRSHLHCQGRFQHGGGGAAALEQQPALLNLWRESLVSLSRSMVVGSFRALPTQGGIKAYDLRHGQAFIDLYRELVHPARTAHDNVAARLEDEIKNLFRLRHFAMVSTGPAHPLVVQVDKSEYPLEEVGSGLAQAIQLMVHALALKPDHIMIDEPECHFHPSFQSAFVTALSGMARQGLVFASHNSGLAKTVADRTYLVKRSADDSHTEVEEVHPEQRLSEVMGEISFSAQQTQGCSKVLLVEGPTEIKAVRQILLKMKADRDIILLPLGGGSMITPNRGDELAEVKKIGQNVYALIDSEKASARAELGQDRIGFRGSCRQAGILCHILERRSFENYFSENPCNESWAGDIEHWSHLKISRTDFRTGRKRITGKLSVT